MGDRTAIGWVRNSDGQPGATWNPWRGCRKVSVGCVNCYMFRDQVRYGHDPAKVVRAAPATFNRPLKWGPGTSVFTCSWSDFFIEDADPWRDEAWAIIRRTPDLHYLILTKRPENIEGRLPADWPEGYGHVSIGITAETQDLLVKRWRHLMGCAVFNGGWGPWISAEPLLGYLNLDADYGEGVGDLISDHCRWLVLGCESGGGSKLGRMGLDPCAPAVSWMIAANQLVQDARNRGVPVFVKQIPMDGKLLKDSTDSRWPAWAVREFPGGAL